MDMDLNEINEVSEVGKGAMTSKSFRLTEETAERIKEFADRERMSQGDALASLIKQFELNKVKGMVQDRDKEIEAFQAKTNEMVSMFTNSLVINKTAEDRIREEVAAEIAKK